MVSVENVDLTKPQDSQEFEMKLCVLSSIAITLVAATFGCDPGDENSKDTDEVVVRVFSDHLYWQPEEPLLVEVYWADSLSGDFMFYQSDSTDEDGFVSFDLSHLHNYKFVVPPCVKVSNSSEFFSILSSEEWRDTVSVNVEYTWHFSTFDFDLPIRLDGGNYAKLTTLYNPGNTYTLQVSPDFSNLPSWLDVELSANSFPPTGIDLDHFISCSYGNGDVPEGIQLPDTFQFQLNHQFGESIFHLILHEVEQP